MTPERMRNIEELYHKARAILPEKRAAFLDQQTAGDSELRQAVETLLSADQQADSFLNTPALGTDFRMGEVPTKAVATDASIGRRVGAYKLEQRIGAGGMGAVYLARRADEQFDMQVAVKLIKRGMDTDDILGRFRNERQLLAQLQHPNIARLIDGGATDDGLPYLVMEYVTGEPIDVFCDRRRLSINRRLELFMKVCDGVQYAHQNLIVHRDLKPTNILVTPNSEPKLLDFGIAKLLQPDGALHTADLTQTGQRFLSPGYASPEQIRGERLTTATDVYSLGVALYELLTGVRPYAVDSGSLQMMQKIICEQEPTRPSVAVLQTHRMARADESGSNQRALNAISAARNLEPGRLQKRLVGDLDNIVLKALSKEPSRRYASVEQLAEDINRHLRGLAVTARPDTIRYRSIKFIRRHRLSVGAAMLVVLSLAGGLVASSILYRRADRARLVAEDMRVQADQARAAAEQINQFVQKMLASVDPRAEGPDVKVRQILDEAAKRVEEDLVGQPTVERGVRMTIGGAYGALGLYEEAMPHLRRALDIDVLRVGPDHTETAQSMAALANVLTERAEFAEAERLYRRALQIEQSAYGDEHERVAEDMNNLALLLYQTGMYDEAEQLYRRSLEIRERLFGEQNAEVAAVLNNLAGTLYIRGDYSGAQALLRDACDMYRDIQGAEHPDTAGCLNNLAGMLMVRRLYAEAEPLFRETLDLRRRLVGDVHPDVAVTLNNLAEVLRNQGKFDQAEPIHRQAYEMRRTLLGDEHPAVARTMNNYALTLSSLGRHQEAADMHRRALAVRRKLLGNDHAETASSINNLAWTLHQMNDAAAVPLFREALAVRRGAFGDLHPKVALTELNLAEALLDVDEIDEAESLCRHALSFFESAEAKAEDASQAKSSAFLILGKILRQAGRIEEAEQAAGACLAQRKAQMPPVPEEIAEAEVELARCLMRSGRFDESESMLLGAHAVLSEAPGGGVSRRHNAQSALVDLYTAWQKPDQTARWQQRMEDESVDSTQSKRNGEQLELAGDAIAD